MLNNVKFTTLHRLGNRPIATALTKDLLMLRLVTYRVRLLFIKKNPLDAHSSGHNNNNNNSLGKVTQKTSKTIAETSKREMYVFAKI